MAALVVFLMVVLPSASTAGDQAGLGQVEGTIRDSQGGVLSEVTLTLRNDASGIERTVETRADGQYRFLAVPPGRYVLTVARQGFAGAEVRDIHVTIGSSLRRDVTLALQAVAQNVLVVAAAPFASRNSAETAGIVAKEQIDTLPIRSRQYLSLALLLPGTSLDATRPIGPAVNVGASMTFNSTANVVDGVNNTFAEDGEPRQSLPQDAVEELKVTAAQYGAEFGLATAGIVQVVSRAGSNEFHGSLFDYFRDKTITAQGHFEKEKPAFRRHQFGGSAGGPIHRRRLHFFAAAERTAIDEFYTVNTGLPQFYSSIEGTFPKPSYRNVYSGRIDWHPRDDHSLFFRYGQEDERTTCILCGGSAATGLDQEVPRRALVAGHTWSFGARALNDIRFQYARAAFYIGPSGTEAFTRTSEFPPERTNRLTRTLMFPSASWGTSGDDAISEARWQIKDTYVRTLSRHEIRAGVDVSYMPYVEGNSGSVGTYTFGEDQYFNPRDPAALAALAGATFFSAVVPPVYTRHPTTYSVAFVQDDWRIRSRLTVNVGLRYERLYGAANEDINPATFPIAIPYIRPEQRGDRNNFGPRFGIVWDAAGDARTLVRAGYGMHYGHVRITGSLSEYRNYRQFFVAIGEPAYPDPYGGRSPQDFAVAAPANIVVVANDVVQPYSHQFNAGISRRLRSDLDLHVDALVTNANHDRKILDINPVNPQTGERPNPLFGEVAQFQSTAFLRYRGLYARIEKRFAGDAQAMVSYTYTRSRDNNPEGQYINPFDTAEDEGPSNGERRHALVASGAARLPWTVSVGAVWTLRSQLPWTPRPGRDVNRDGVLNDLIPGVGRNTGRDLDLDSVNVWRARFGLRPILREQLDSSRVNLLDLRASKRVDLRAVRLDVIAQIFNVFNTLNLGEQFERGRVTNALSANFGRILTARPGRQGELALRLVW
jgi:hypothetical protein